MPGNRSASGVPGGAGGHAGGRGGPVRAPPGTATRFGTWRLERLSGERERLLDLYLGGDIDRETFRARKEKIEAEIRELEARMTDQTTLAQARELVALALRLARDCYRSYRKSSPETKKLGTRRSSTA